MTLCHILPERRGLVNMITFTFGQVHLGIPYVNYITHPTKECFEYLIKLHLVRSSCSGAQESVTLRCHYSQVSLIADITNTLQYNTLQLLLICHLYDEDDKPDEFVL